MFGPALIQKFTAERIRRLGRFETPLSNEEPGSSAMVLGARNTQQSWGAAPC